MLNGLKLCCENSPLGLPQRRASSWTSRFRCCSSTTWGLCRRQSSAVNFVSLCTPGRSCKIMQREFWRSFGSCISFKITTQSSVCRTVGRGKKNENNLHRHFFINFFILEDTEHDTLNPILTGLFESKFLLGGGSIWPPPPPLQISAPKGPIAARFCMDVKTHVKSIATIFFFNKL